MARYCRGVKVGATVKRFTLFAFIALWLNAQVFADTEYFIIQEKDRILKLEGDCTKRHSPGSTFKIAISLMGYNEGLLTDETHPEWEFKPG